MRGYFGLGAGHTRIELGSGPECLTQRKHEVLREGLGEVDEVAVLRRRCCWGIVAAFAAVVVANVVPAVAGEREAAGQQLAHDGVVHDEREE